MVFAEETELARVAAFGRLVADGLTVEAWLAEASSTWERASFEVGRAVLVALELPLEYGCLVPRPVLSCACESSASAMKEPVVRAAMKRVRSDLPEDFS